MLLWEKKYNENKLASFLNKNEDQDFMQSYQNGIDIINAVYDKLIAGLNGKYFNTLKNSTDVMNHINSVASELGYENFNMDYNDEYEAVKERFKDWLKNKMKKEGIEINKELLKETSFELPSPRNILNYEDDDVVKIIKQVFKDNFKDYKLLTIQDNEGGRFLNMDISINVKSDVKDDLELKRFMLAQILAKFRADLFTELSNFLPVVNVNTAAYEFSRDSDKLTFAAVLCLSNTNNRNWVSGRRQKIDANKVSNFVDKAGKK